MSWRDIFPVLSARALRLPGMLPGRPEGDEEAVILLHGLGRTSASMRIMQWALEHHGYRVVNPSYPSRKARIDELADLVIPDAISACADARHIHFVTHSMGGILLRHWLARNPLPQPGRAVLLGPPNGGSEIVDRFGAWRLFEAINGPAGKQLGTDPDSMPHALSSATGLQVGVIAGSRSWNPIYSAAIDGPNDGKVSVASAFDIEARDKLVLPVSHTWMMMDPRVITATMRFLDVGRFEDSTSKD